MSTINIALVGSGSMGLNHARVIATGPDTALSVVVEPREDVGRSVADRHSAKWVPELTDTQGIDAVVVAASTEHHHALVVPLLEAGMPVLVEKPVCASLGQTLEVLHVAERKGVPLMCGLLERFNPAVIVARAMVSEPRYARAERHSPYAPRIKTGVGWDLLVHDVDLIAQLFGGQRPESINVEVGYFHPESQSGAEDVVEAALVFGDGAIATASASRIGQRKVRTLVIQEIGRMIEVDLLRRGVTSYRHLTLDGDEGRGGYRQVTEMEVPEVTGAEPLVSQLAHFVRLLRGDVDMDVERSSIVSAHEIVDRALATASTAASGVDHPVRTAPTTAGTADPADR
jgi:predicted dehydrogenase